jgi:uncharacterized protein (TIGR02246 family)
MTTDEQAINDILGRLEVAWNAGDSTSFAASFREDAIFIHIFGGQLDGGPAIEAAHRHIFETLYKGSRASYLLRSVRFIRPDVAIVLVRQHVNFYEGNETREIDTRPTLIMVKEQGQWHIVALQNTRISEVPAAAQDASRLAS